MRTSSLVSLALACLLLPALARVVTAAPGARPQEAPSSSPAELSPEERDEQFEELMTSSRLVGKFSVVGPEGESAPQADLYMVSDLSRGEGDSWVFTSRMKFGENEMTFPVPTQVKWAGDTPVISLTDQTIPGLGTFTARVMIYKDRYAGTWQHGPVGGHMWGLLEPLEESGEATDSDAAGSSEP